MEPAPVTTCPNCRRLQQQVDDLQQAVADLTQQLLLLQQQLACAAKDSSTSSKPPSSDLVKPPKPAPPEGQAKRRRGGQPGHPRHERALLPLEQLAGPPVEHRLFCCPDCHGNLHPAAIQPRRLQQVELPDALAFTTE